MAFTSTALAAVGAGVSAYGAYSGAASQKLQYNSMADTAAMNARLAELQAQGRLASGQREEQKQRLATAGVRSAQQVGFAANNIDMAGGGSPARVLASTDVLGDIDALTIRSNSVTAANEARMDAVNYQNDARTGRAAAKGVNPGGAALTSLLGSATELSSKWYSMNQAGGYKTKAS